jgi:rhamnosyl/mannosyltransferase
MRILHVYKDFDPPVRGGMERHMALMCRFQLEWAEVQALTCGRRPWARKTLRDGTEVVEAGEWGRFQSTPLAPLFPWHLRRNRADVVVLHVPMPTAELSYLMASPPGALIVRYQSDVVRQARAMKLYRPFQMKLLDKADRILVASPQYLESSETLAPFHRKCEVIPLGVVPESFESPGKAPVEALRRSYGGRFVLYAGRHRYYKGLEYLVRAAPHIHAQVVIAGQGPETPRLRALSRELRADVRFPGSLTDDDLTAHLHAADVFVFPSVERSEAYGISMVEAHACGTPVVATTLGTGVEFVNRHGETGLNAPPRDAAALAEAVNTLLSDDALRQRMGTRARDRVRRDLSARHIARREFELYQQVRHP